MERRNERNYAMTLDVLPLDEVKSLSLARGKHSDRSSGLCVMEAVAWVAGEPHSDRPLCTSQLIGAFCRSWNDAMSDDDRNEFLKPLIPHLIGTYDAKEDERRGLLVIDWLIREFLPAWFELVPALVTHVKVLHDAKPVQSWDDVKVITTALNDSRSAAAAARIAARNAARNAARDAAWNAAWDIARAAARDAAWDAAWNVARAAARNAAEDAAWIAARDAAWIAAWDAAGAMAAAGVIAVAALKSTRRKLQESASKLVLRMCAVGKHAN